MRRGISPAKAKQENQDAEFYNKKEYPMKVMLRSFQITTKEAWEAHDVVPGTIVVNSFTVSVLFSSGAN